MFNDKPAPAKDGTSQGHALDTVITDVKEDGHDYTAISIIITPDGLIAVAPTTSSHDGVVSAQQRVLKAATAQFAIAFGFDKTREGV